jgi:hypothetical protein
MKPMRVIRSLSLSLLVCLVMIVAAVPTSEAGNRCTDRCADVYRLKKDACKLIPYKHERHRCEDAAKRAKNECKRRCR